MPLPGSTPVDLPNANEITPTPIPPAKYHIEASGHPTKPDLAGTVPELPDFTGYRFVFYREIKE